MTRRPLPTSAYTPRARLSRFIAPTPEPLSRPGAFGRWYARQQRPHWIWIVAGMLWILALGMLAMFGAVSIPKPGGAP